MITQEMEELALLLARVGDVARMAWMRQEVTGGQELHTRQGETMDYFSDLDEKLDGMLIDGLATRLGVNRFLTEEGSRMPERNAVGGRRAVIDSMDGSANLLTGRPDFGISVAIEQDGEPGLAGIYAPARGELLVAARGQGAYLFSCYGLNLLDIERLIQKGERGARLVTTGTFALPKNVKKRGSPLETSRINVHTGKRRNFELSPADPWNTIYSKCANPGCIFCCTVAMVEVALGKLDGAAIGFQNYWDFAAGRLILAEAGGHFAAFTRDYLRQLTSRDFAQAHASKTPDGDEWLCHIFAAGSAKLFGAITRHFTGG